MKIKRKVFGIIAVVATFIGILTQVPIRTINAEEDLGDIEEILTLYEEEHDSGAWVNVKETEELIEQSRSILEGKSYEDTVDLYKWLEERDDLSLEGQVLKSEVERSITFYQILYGAVGVLFAFFAIVILIKVVDGY